MSASRFSPPSAEILPVRGDVFDFSAIPAFGPLPLIDESGPAPVGASPPRRGAVLAAAVVVAVSAGCATWSAATRPHERSGSDARSSQAAIALGDPTTTGSIPLTLRPTIR